MSTSDQIVQTMAELYLALHQGHPHAEITQYVADTLKQLQDSNGVAFTGAFQNFLNRMPVVKLADDLTFTADEQRLLQRITSFTQLGNNLWATSL